jgi:hypothetical protein
MSPVCRAGRCSGQKMWWIMRGWGGRGRKVCISPGQLVGSITRCWQKPALRCVVGGVDVRDRLCELDLTCLFRLVCCIYHAPKAVGESSSEDDSSSGSESDGSDSGVDDGAARMVGGSGKRTRRHTHDHRHGHGDECGDGGQGKRRPSPNAYERMPKPRGRREVKN